LKELQQANQELERLNIEMREISDERIKLAKSNLQITRGIKKIYKKLLKTGSRSPEADKGQSEKHSIKSSQAKKAKKNASSSNSSSTFLRAHSGPSKPGVELQTISEEKTYD
jgi:septal ring factor EnvC (AmiA/AmiB activator)